MEAWLALLEAEETGVPASSSNTASSANTNITALQDSEENIGLRVAELAARFYIDPHLPTSAFTSMLCWLDQQRPGCVGETNHTFNFVRDFGRVMIMHLNFCSAVEHWQRVPALNIPSDFARVVDGYTCMGEPLLLLVHCLTNAKGDLVWHHEIMRKDFQASGNHVHFQKMLLEPEGPSVPRVSM